MTDRDEIDAYATFDELPPRERPTSPAASQAPQKQGGDPLETPAILMKEATDAVKSMAEEVRLYRAELLDPNGPVAKLISSIVEAKLEAYFKQERADYKLVRRRLRSMSERMGEIEQELDDQAGVNEEVDRRLKLLEAERAAAPTEPPPPVGG